MNATPTFDPVRITAIAREIGKPMIIVRDTTNGQLGLADMPPSAGQSFEMMGYLPAAYPEWLGSRSFREDNGLQFAYVGGAMARGIASVDLCIALANMGGIGFFGSAGLPVDQILSAVRQLHASLGPDRWGTNLIHSPNEPGLEERIVDLYLANDARRVSASAFMQLEPSVVRYACSNLKRGADGRVLRYNRLFAKVSRTEVATPFLQPPPQKMLHALVEKGALTPEEASLAQEISLAVAITAEADSGGHTDNRPLTALLPAFQNLRDEIAASFPPARQVSIGAAGGLGDPRAIAAAFAAGADYVLIGSVHQATREAATSDTVKDMLSRADVADFTMAPAGDMFETGVNVQVLRKGSLMPQRGRELYDLYRRHKAIEDIPSADRQRLERDVFRKPFDAIWTDTQAYYRQADPALLARAQTDGRAQMSMMFRWYLGKSSRWAIEGAPDRALDYQVWCGPAMGSFNRWTKGTALADPANRNAATVGLTLMQETERQTRLRQLETYGVLDPVRR
jgi:trans-AT polyketide synthase/acyltransferase/oxidoreductase domain-containing protein